MEDDFLMKIGEIAAFFNVSVKAVRIYEQKGIIKPTKVDAVTGYRYYTTAQVQQINALLELKALGFSLVEIRKILTGGINNEQFREALIGKRTAWQESIALAENKIDAINTIKDRFEKSKDAVKLKEMTEEQRAWLLVKMVCVEDLRVQSAISEAIWL